MYILKDVDFSKLIKRNLNEKHTLLIEYLDLNGKKQKKHWRNNGKDIYLDGIKELIKARVGNDKAWKNVLNIVKEKMLVKKPQLDFDEVEEIDMYSITSLNQNNLTNIYKNIENFANLWKKYRNILFVCGDYPGYGGAATNCDRLQIFFKERGYNTFAFYYNNDKSVISKSQDIWIEEKSQIKNIPFVPDLIITKSFFNSLNLKNLFNVPVIYCVGGIFPNSLDKYFYDMSENEIKNICNKNVIQEIKNSDFVFVNSSHTRDILKEKFNLHSYIFYSSFIQYYNKKSVPFIDNTFEERNYEYGVIMSNFERLIKNVRESIEFLKDKKNVILIGQNSSQFKNYGFTCIELVKNKEMDKYYRQIKYIIQDSFYESCSNVRIESLFNGCKIKNSFNNKNITFGILLAQQSEINFFQQYTNFIGNKFLDLNINAGIFLYKSSKVKLNTIKSSLNICHVNDNNIFNVIKYKYSLSKLLILYLPLSLVDHFVNFDRVMNDKLIQKYVFFGGIVNHMYKYIDKYNITNTLGYGNAYKLLYNNIKHFNLSELYYPEFNYPLEYKKKSIKKKFISIGRFSIEKNQLFLIKSFHLFLKETEDTSFILYVVGTNNNKIKSSIIDYINKYKLIDNIKIINWMSQKDLYQFCIQNIDYNILTSTNEGLNSTCLEMMKLGIPTISSNVYCINELITNNENGLLFEYKNYLNIFHDSKTIKTHPTTLVNKINNYEKYNKQNLVKILQKTIDNEELLNKLSKNCISYIENLKPDSYNFFK